MVVLNGYDAIKEAFHKRGADFAGRNPGPFVKALNYKDGMLYNRSWFYRTFKKGGCSFMLEHKLEY